MPVATILLNVWDPDFHAAYDVGAEIVLLLAAGGSKSNMLSRNGVGSSSEELVLVGEGELKGEVLLSEGEARLELLSPRCVMSTMRFCFNLVARLCLVPEENVEPTECGEMGELGG